MKITYQHVVGSLVTISATLWGVLIWLHFPNSPLTTLIIPAVIIFIIALIIEMN